MQISNPDATAEGRRGTQSVNRKTESLDASSKMRLMRETGLVLGLFPIPTELEKLASERGWERRLEPGSNLRKRQVHPGPVEKKQPACVSWGERGDLWPSKRLSPLGSAPLRLCTPGHTLLHSTPPPHCLLMICTPFPHPSHLSVAHTSSPHPWLGKSRYLWPKLQVHISNSSPPWRSPHEI